MKVNNSLSNIVSSFQFVSLILIWVQGIKFARSEGVCGLPPVVEKATINSINGTEFKIGTVLKYSCSFGFAKDQTLSTIECVPGDRNGTAVWTKSNFRCTARSCSEPGVGDHGKVIGSVFTFPNSVTYECEDGYQLVGPAKRFCQTTGEWSGTVPSCRQISCEAPKNIINGRVVYESLEFGSELRYECDKGFSLNGTVKRTCQSNGLWSGSSPVCVEMRCNYPEVPKHGSVEVVGGVPKVDSIAFYTCNEGLVLIGSYRTKCLSSGQWTYDPPECLDPCSVPDISNGAFYSNSWSTRNSIPAGTIIDGRKSLYLRCNNYYEPSGKPLKVYELSCVDGKWSDEPNCVEASCRSPAPKVPFATLKTREITPGTVLTYICDHSYYKAEFGRTVCAFGIWTGKQPVCKNSFCKFHSLVYPGLISEKKTVFANGTNFTPQCKKGYEVKVENNTITCINGEWHGNFPPCVPRNCHEPPPVLGNGTAEYYTKQHGNEVKYVCNDHFTLEKSLNPVKCKLGKWEGDVPVCKDSRCYMDTLLIKDGIDLSRHRPVFSGSHAELHCLEGYTLKRGGPLCRNGKWDHSTSAITFTYCFPSNCRVDYVAYGTMFEKKVTTSLGLRMAIYDEVPIKSEYSSGSILHVMCEKNYIFHGINDREFVPVACEKGKWNPMPICLKPGSPVIESTLSDRKPNSATIPPVTKQMTETDVGANHVTSTNASTPGTTKTSTISPVDTQVTSVINDHENCTCIYNMLDDTVLAFSGYKLLNFGDKVKNGCVINFICSIFGYHRLRGVSELQCLNCKWHSTQYPTCELPRKGDPIFSFSTEHSGYITVTSSGVLNVAAGIDIQIKCYLLNVSDWATLKGPSSELSVRYNEQWNESKQNYDLFSIFVIERVDQSSSGSYICSKKDGRNPISIQIEVEELQCPILVVENDILITYEGKQNLHSAASFSCHDKNKKVYGAERITCLEDRKWSAAVPTCEFFIDCPEMPETEGLTISYSNGGKVNSVAAFHCSRPYRRKGAPHVTCLVGGEWSGSPSTCYKPTCSVDSAYNSLPMTMAPILQNGTGDTVPYGTTFNVVCRDESYVTVGDDIIVCNETGNWTVGKVFCVFGCRPVKKLEGSSLIIQPQQELFEFGESVVFLCLTGQSLTLPVERAMCLGNKWSSDLIPDCVDSIG